MQQNFYNYPQTQGYTLSPYTGGQIFMGGQPGGPFGQLQTGHGTAAGSSPVSFKLPAFGLATTEAREES